MFGAFVQRVLAKVFGDPFTNVLFFVTSCQALTCTMSVIIFIDCFAFANWLIIEKILFINFIKKI